MGAVPPDEQENCLSITTPSVAVASRLLASPDLYQAPCLCYPHHCPGFPVSHISESARADLFSGRAPRPLRGGAVASSTTNPSRVFTASATHTLVLVTHVTTGTQDFALSVSF